MSTGSIPRLVDSRSRKPGELFIPLERIAERVEQELARLRQMRPALQTRIDRASTILVVHLSNPRSGMIRVPVGADRRPRFLVSSASSGGVVYSVDPCTWECSCPDYHRRNGGACKHSIAAWVLYKIAISKECYVCDGRGWVHIGFITKGGEEVTEGVPCKVCRGPA